MNCRDRYVVDAYGGQGVARTLDAMALLRHREQPRPDSYRLRLLVVIGA